VLRLAFSLLGTEGGTARLTPVVLLLHSRRARVLLDPKRPELALFAAWAMQARHGAAAVRIVERAIDVSGNLPPPLRKAQWHAIFDVLSDRMRSRLREAAMHPDRVPERPATRKLRLFIEAMAEKRFKRDALLMVLKHRKMVPTAAQQARIDACMDPKVLDGWFKRAFKAESVADTLRRKAAPRAASKRRAAPRRATPRRTAPGKRKPAARSKK
jgi:hypothetical protein